MSQIDYWFKAVAYLKEDQRKREEELLKLEGLMEGIEKVSTYSLDKAIAPIVKLVIKLARINDADHIFFFETLLTLFSGMAKDVDTLKTLVSSVASGKEELKGEMEKVRKSLQERDRISKELESIVKQRRKFFEEHR